MGSPAREEETPMQEVRADDRHDGEVPLPEDVLRRSGAPFEVLDHVPILGRHDAETELGLPTELLLKTMVFRTAEGVFVLAVLPVTARVNYGKLARAAGVPRSRLRR
jgi:Cys-tRNA(Pro)/Cys-tRNA(Cys) deacylase